jgi:hypothetical protein
MHHEDTKNTKVHEEKNKNLRLLVDVVVVDFPLSPQAGGGRSAAATHGRRSPATPSPPNPPLEGEGESGRSLIFK